MLADRAGLDVDLVRLFTNPLTAGHMKTETLLRILPRRWIDMFEAATRRLPFSLQQKLLVQMAVRFRKREPVSDEICSREQDSIR